MGDARCTALQHPPISSGFIVLRCAAILWPPLRQVHSDKFTPLLEWPFFCSSRNSCFLSLLPQ